MKWILTCFELVPGMCINYHKSELLSIDLDEGELESFLGIFQCIAGSFQIKYLGLPLHFNKLSREDLQPR